MLLWDEPGPTGVWSSAARGNLEPQIGVPREAWTAEDLVQFVRSRGIRVVALMHVGGDGWLKTLDFVPRSDEHLRDVLTAGERADGSSLFSELGIAAGQSDVVLRPGPRPRSSTRSPPRPPWWSSAATAGGTGGRLRSRRTPSCAGRTSGSTRRPVSTSGPWARSSSSSAGGPPTTTPSGRPSGATTRRPRSCSARRSAAGRSPSSPTSRSRSATGTARSATSSRRRPGAGSGSSTRSSWTSSPCRRPPTPSS